jgi:hypothetical protein
MCEQIPKRGRQWSCSSRSTERERDKFHQGEKRSSEERRERSREGKTSRDLLADSRLKEAQNTKRDEEVSVRDRAIELVNQS